MQFLPMQQSNGWDLIYANSLDADNFPLGYAGVLNTLSIATDQIIVAGYDAISVLVSFIPLGPPPPPAVHVIEIVAEWGANEMFGSDLLWAMNGAPASYAVWLDDQSVAPVALHLLPIGWPARPADASLRLFARNDSAVWPPGTTSAMLVAVTGRRSVR